jgi:hypothetical protein
MAGSNALTLLDLATGGKHFAVFPGRSDQKHKS